MSISTHQIERAATTFALLIAVIVPTTSAVAGNVTYHYRYQSQSNRLDRISIGSDHNYRVYSTNGNQTAAIPGTSDVDGDGVTTASEIDVHGTDALDADTDADGLIDGHEIALGIDPLDVDSDDDALDDAAELEHGTRPDLADTDSDRTNDGQEVAAKRDPLTHDGQRSLQLLPYLLVEPEPLP